MMRVGLVGLRGHAGAEIVRLMATRDDMVLSYAASRQGAGEPAHQLAPGAPDDLMIADPNPEDLVAQSLDAVILALPNGVAAPYVAALKKKLDWIVVDLSADYRYSPDWTYSLPATLGEDRVRDARRIANPGCYATAAQLALWPLRSHLAGPAVVTGLSGYSGAGTTPSPKNDLSRLADSIMPYALAGHGHEAEIARGIGHPIWFTPHVCQFFRGLIVTVNAGLDPAVDARALMRDAYEGKFAITLQEEPVEVGQVAGRLGARISLPVQVGDRVVITAGLDNLLLGAAEQALQNLCLAAGLQP